MLSPIEELKIQAKKLLKQPQPPAALLQLAKKDPLKLKHCHLFIARKYGFAHWGHALEVFNGQPCDDRGTFWYNNRCATLLNHWCANYQEAVAIQKQQGGTVLPYKKQFMVVDKPFLTIVGVDYDLLEWQLLKHNWCEGDLAARQSLALARIKAW